jgi:t-SNARE complex subunit (syntaxin)
MKRWVVLDCFRGYDRQARARRAICFIILCIVVALAVVALAHFLACPNMPAHHVPVGW